MVIDASALLAYFQREPGHERVARQIREGASMCSVNVTEVLGKLCGSGLALENEARDDVRNLGLTLIAFSAELAFDASFFYARRSAHKLSLGDCACLALAESRAAGVLTAERSWAELPGLRVQVEVIR